ncbi:hypothetical protein BSKO_10808 [Bryopsis sp. KO-2023]|nr:hypothetical protein BSKO_10808 [Bryopsis sp. KO-2023]
MVKFKFSATLAAPAEVYFVERDTDEFRELQAKVMKLGELRVIDETKHVDKHVVRLATMPNARKYIPGGILKRLGIEDVRFEDILLYDKNQVTGPSYTLTFTSIPPLAVEKIKVAGRLTIEPIDEHHCLQTLEGTADIKVFGIGSIAEPLLVESLSRSYKQLPKVVEKWMMRREEILMEQGLQGLLRGRPNMNWLPGDLDRQNSCQLYRSPLVAHIPAAPMVGMSDGRVDSESNGSDASSQMAEGMEILCDSIDLIDMGARDEAEIASRSGTDMFYEIDEMDIDGATPHAQQTPLSEDFFSVDYLSGGGGNPFPAGRSPLSSDGDLSMHSAISSLRSTSTKSSVKIHRRALARAQRTGWCGLGMPSPVKGDYESERLGGIEDDEIIRKHSIGVLGDIGNQGGAATGDARNQAMPNRLEEDGQIRGKQRWLFCGAPPNRRKAEHHCEPSRESSSSNDSGCSSNGSKDGKSHHLRRLKMLGRKSNKPDIKNDCRCWSMCAAPRSLE